MYEPDFLCIDWEDGPFFDREVVIVVEEGPQVVTPEDVLRRGTFEASGCSRVRLVAGEPLCFGGDR